ncbi:MAG TPA: trypsin-like peptidase domain-containing protein [Terriglobales bacterium]|nr:trypsin-like peptidase domain-containing protein [Terriglobales bacterium]
MKTRAFALVFVLLLPAVAISQTKPTKEEARRTESLRGFSDSVQALADRVRKCVVQIDTVGYGITSDSERKNAEFFTQERSTGSGVILSADGFIITNAHVVQSARKIRVRLIGLEHEQRQSGAVGTRGMLEGALIGVDRLSDLALIKINQKSLPFLDLADSRDLKQGQVVLAFGSPLGLENSVSMGVISAVARQIDPDNPMIYIQTDAAINPGNSGGPLVDVDGHVVGINTFILTQSGGSEGIGFAIPSNVVRNIYQQLSADGHVHRGMIGVFARTITPALASGLSLPSDDGVLLEDVAPGGPAEKAGLKVGDVVLAIDGSPVENVRQFALDLYRYRIGDLVHVQVWRGGQKTSFAVPVVEQADDPTRFADMVDPQRDVVPRLAILGLSITSDVRAMLPDLRYESGVIVAARTQGNTGSSSGPQPGDVIYAVNGKHVDNVTALRGALDQIKPDQPLVLQIQRQGQLSYMVLDSE